MQKNMNDNPVPASIPNPYKTKAHAKLNKQVVHSHHRTIKPFNQHRKKHIMVQGAIEQGGGYRPGGFIGRGDRLHDFVGGGGVNFTGEGAEGSWCGSKGEEGKGGGYRND